MPKLRTLLSYLILAGLAMQLNSCAPHSENLIVVGSKMDTEGAILGYIQLLALQEAGYSVEDRIETGPTLIVRRALLSGDIDGYIEYTGTALVNFMGETRRPLLSDPRGGYRAVHDWDSTRNRIIWLKPWSGINNTYTVLMKKAEARAMEISSISDMARFLKRGGKLLFGVDHEFAARPDGLNGLLKTYGMDRLSNLRILQMDAGLVYQTLKQGSIDAAIGYSTDGRIAAFDLIRLKDDRQFFPVYNPTPIYRQETLERFPGVRSILNAIADRITADDITDMNYRHDVELRRAKLLAREWLEKQGLPSAGNLRGVLPQRR